MADQGFHEGELAVQTRAGVRAQAARLGETMLAVPDLNGGIGGFLAERDFAVLSARDTEGRLWISPLVASAGFLEARNRGLTIHAAPAAGDALHRLVDGQAVGLLAIEFAARRRVRVNGTLTYAGPHELQIVVDQAFGNCPKYIQQRRLVHTGPSELAADRLVRSATLADEDVALIARADTFFLGTVHPTRGADASHRGGTPGFVRVEGGELWWPDYPGNNMFNSLGNLEVDDSAALLFVDFESGASLQISGTAALEWITPGAAGDDGGTGRRVRFTIESVASGYRLAVHSDAPQPSPHNPPTT
jgi:uncharacterized protein